MVAFNVRKLVTRTGVGLLAATTHEDIVEDLAPGCAGALPATTTIAVERRVRQRRSISFAHELHVTEGTNADWPYFARWHYRGHRLAFVKRVIVLLWHGDEPVGICVFATPAASLSLRTWFFGLKRSALVGRAGGAERALVAASARGVAPDVSRGWYRVGVRAPRVRTMPGRLDRNADRDGPRQSVLRARRVRESRRHRAQRQSRAVRPARRHHRRDTAKSRFSDPIYYVFDNRKRGHATNEIVT